MNDESVFDLYRSECERLGHTPVLIPPGFGESVWVSEDPERTWSEIGPYLLYQATTYASWQARSGGSVVKSGAQTQEALRAEGKYLVLTPEQCVAHARKRPSVVHFPLCGGTPPDLAWPSLELYAQKVLPHL